MHLNLLRPARRAARAHRASRPAAALTGLALLVSALTGVAVAAPASAGPGATVDPSYPSGTSSLVVSRADGSFALDVTLAGCTHVPDQALTFIISGNGSGPGQPWRNFRYVTTASTPYHATFGPGWPVLPYTDPSGTSSQTFRIDVSLTALDGLPVPESSTLMLGAFQGLSCINGGQSGPLSLTVTDPDKPVWETTTLPSLQVGTPVSVPLSATKATAYTHTGGDLPAGLALNPATGTLSGTPTTPGPVDFTVTATSATSWSEQRFTGTVLPAPLDAPAHVQTTTSATTAVLTWDTAPHTWEARVHDVAGWGPWSPVDQPRLELTGLLPATSYQVELRSVDSTQVRPTSAPVSLLVQTLDAPVVTPPVVPGPPVTPKPPVTPEPPVTPTPPALVPVSSIVLDALPGDVVAGSQTTVTASGLRAGAAFTVVLRSTPQLLASGTVPADGALLRTLTIPAGLEAGWHSLTLTSTAADGTALVDVMWFEITALGALVATSTTEPVVAAPAVRATTATLAATGSEPGTAVLLAGLLVLAGGLALHRSRRTAR